MPSQNDQVGANEIGPGSLLWHYAGDWRIGFTGLSAGIEQLMLPDLSAGVEQHSDFFNEPWQRIFRSIPPILGTIYDADPVATGHWIRNIHKKVVGPDEHGHDYRALDSETFWWPHATFHNMVKGVIERFSLRELTPELGEQLYDESKVWYSRYGVSNRAQPETYDDYEKKLRHIRLNILQMTPSAERALDIAFSGDVERIPGFPKELWMFLRLPISDHVRLVTIGGLAPEIRERFNLPWSDFDDFRLKALEKAVRNTWRFVPGRLRYHERARAGKRAAKAA